MAYYSTMLENIKKLLSLDRKIHSLATLLAEEAENQNTNGTKMIYRITESLEQKRKNKIRFQSEIIHLH